MSYLLVRRDQGGALLTDGWRVPASEVAEVRRAAELAAELERRTAGLEARARRAEDEGRQAGYAAGLAEGRRSGAAAVASALEALIGEVRTDRDALRAELGRLSLEVVRHVAQELGPQAVLEAVAERAVREVLSEAPLKVRVAPPAVLGVRRRLQSVSADVEVVSDLGVGEGECVVTSRHGSTHAGLVVQLAALERAFGA